MTELKIHHPHLPRLTMHLPTITVFCLSVLATLGLHAENILHISPVGENRKMGDGKALPDFAAARDAIRIIRQNDKQKRTEDFTVIVHPGTYQFTGTLGLGAKEYNTTWRAAKPNSVVITGGPEFTAALATPLTEAEKKRLNTPEAGEKILRLDLAKAGVTGDLGEISPRGFARPYRPLQAELSIDGKSLDLARWPNTGEKNIPIGKIIDKGSIPRDKDFSKRGGTFQFGSERINRWREAPDAWIYGYFSHGYSDDSVKIAAIDPAAKSLKTVQPSRYGFMTGAAWRSFYGFNLFEELDRPGEYYIDRRARVLYFIPPDGFDRKKSILSLSMLSGPMVAIENTRNVTLQGFTFENTRGMGIYMEETRDCTVDRCTLRNIGMVAVVIGNGVESSEETNEFHDSILALRALPRVLGNINERIYADSTFQRRGGSGNAVTNCEIHDIGCGGLHIGGGDFKTLTRAANRVENCHIHHVNRVEKSYRSAVNLDGVGQIVRHNLIEDTLQSAIYFHGNDHLIEYNRFNRCLTYGDDMGVIYYGRNPAELGTTVRYNWFQDCGRGHTSNTPVIYADDGACNLTVHGNLFVNSGTAETFLLGGGSYHQIHDNVFVGCAVAVRIGNRMQSWAKGMLDKGGIVETRLAAIRSKAFDEHYPFFVRFLEKNPGLPQHNQFQRNILFNSAGLGGNAAYIAFKNNLITKTNPGFKDPAANDWRLTLTPDAAKTLGGGFTPPPVEQMGRSTDK